MPTNGSTSPFAEEWNNTIKQLEEAGISTRELEAVGISRRTFQRHKNRPGGPRETTKSREMLAILKPLLVMKLRRGARAATAKARKFKRLAKEHSAGFVWGGTAIAAVALLHPIAHQHGWCPFCVWMFT